jgi:predicted nucleotide-binding protein
MPRGPARPHPPFPLAEARTVAEAVRESNAGKPINRILLAQAMGLSPNNSKFRDLIMASYRYGLTEGNYKSETISLTPSGENLSQPRDEAERVQALRDAFKHVAIYEQLLNHFANQKLPDTQFVKNIIERKPFSISPEWSKEVADGFAADAEHVGFLREVSGSRYIVLDASVAEPLRETGVTPVATAPTPSDGPVDRAHPVDAPAAEAPQQRDAPPLLAPTVRPKPIQMFIAHGSRRKPLEQLEKILNEWMVPFVVAVDEPNAGRPISQKVADLMNDCTAGIFIFTGDDEFTDAAGQTVFRPSQNVVYELGAASLLYGRKIVIFREVGVSFPSDFSDLGWIDFDRDALDAKAADLLRELVALKAVRFVLGAAE